MSNHTSPTSENNPRGPTSRLAQEHASWLSRLLQAIGERLFAAEDAAAVRHGWQVTRRQGGLGRQYRDPRFNTRAAQAHRAEGRTR